MSELSVPGFSLGKILLSHYGEDEVLSRPRQHRSSLVVPGRMVNGKWSTLHEVGNRKLLYYDEADAHSFVRNFYNLMVMQSMDSDSLGSSTYASGELGMKDTGGTVDTLTRNPVYSTSASGSVTFGYRGVAGTNAQGIQAGLGDGAGSAAAFSFEDFALEALIAEGTGTDQMNYVAMDDYTVADIVHSGGTLKWTATYERFLNNNSGGSIVIEEVGLAIDTSTPGGAAYLVARDVLGGSALTIADSGQLKVTYTISSPAFPS